MRFVRFGRPESRAEVETLIHQYMAEQATRGWTKWRLADHEGRLVGRAGFGGGPERRGVSYVVRRSRQGQGLATEVTRALVNWHLANAGAVPLRGLVAMGNDASGRVLEKSGFDEAGPEDYAGTICRVFNYPHPA